MFFDHRTKKFSGKFVEISDEERDAIAKGVAAGQLESTEHPSDEILGTYDITRVPYSFDDGMIERLRKRGVNV